MLDSEQSHVLITSFKSDFKTPNSNVDFKIISFNNMKKKMKYVSIFKKQ